jgi:hypothetical protein
MIRFVLGVLIGASVAAAYAQQRNPLDTGPIGGTFSGPLAGTSMQPIPDALAHGISPKGDWPVIHTDSEGRVICAPEVKP